MLWFVPNIRLHEPIQLSTNLEDVRREPSLTLCDLPSFRTAAGPIARTVWKQLDSSGALSDVLEAANNFSDYVLRITCSCTWLEPGFISQFGPKWHTDRAHRRTLMDGNEYLDTSHRLGHRSFLIVSQFFAEDELPSSKNESHTTAFVKRPVGVDVSSTTVARDILDSAIDDKVSRLKSSDILKAKNAQPVGFDEHTIHKACPTDQPGWRFFLKVGLYQPGYSPFENRLNTFNPVFYQNDGSQVFRKVNSKEKVLNLKEWSTAVA